MSDNAEWTIDTFRPEDAPGVVELYRAVYGEEYPVKAVYNPEELIRQSTTGEAYRTVARTIDGEVVGHSALYRSSPPNKNLYECGQLMVRQDYRQSGIAASLDNYSLTEIPARYGIEQVWGEAVCNHLVTQQSAVRNGFYVAALEVDLMPAQSYARAFSQSLGNGGRVSTLVAAKTYASKPQMVYLPAIYKEPLEYLYSLGQFDHTFITSDQGFNSNSKTKGKVDVFGGAGVARITILELGEAFAVYIEQAEQQAISEGSTVLQVFLPLGQPCIGAGVEILRDYGYFFGGLLPRWFDHDGLLMQKIMTEPNWSGIRLYAKTAKKLLEFIQEDWRKVTSAS